MSPLKDLRLVLLPTKEVHHYQCFGGVLCQTIHRLSTKSSQTNALGDRAGEVAILWLSAPLLLI